MPAPASTTLPDGTYGCQMIGCGIGGPIMSASGIGKIARSKGAYEALGDKKGGRVQIGGDRLTFLGGPFDGWVAQIATSTGGTYFRFSGSDRRNPGPKSQTNDDLCYLLKQ